MFYSVPYLTLVVIYAFLALWYYKCNSTERRTENILICTITAFVFFGMRGFVMHDWISYYNIFIDLNTYEFSTSSLPKYELGFAYLMYICKSFYPNYFFFVFIITLIEISLLMRFLVKHTSNAPFAFMLCISLGYLGVFMDLLRNGIALCILVNALDYIYKRKPLQYFSLCIIACLFHNSSLIFFPLYFFLHKKTSKYVLSTIFTIGIIIFVLRIPLFVSLAEMVISQVDKNMMFYLEVYLNDNKPSPINIVFVGRLATGILALIYIDKLRVLRKDANIYINALFLYLFIQIFGYEFVVGAGRLAHLFEYGVWIIWIDLIRCIDNNNNRKIMISLMCIYCLFRVYGQTKEKALAEYDNVLIETQSFTERSKTYRQNITD